MPGSCVTGGGGSQGRLPGGDISLREGTESVDWEGDCQQQQRHEYQHVAISGEGGQEQHAG